MIFPKFQAPWANWTTEAAGAFVLRLFLAMVLIIQGGVEFYSADGKNTGPAEKEDEDPPTIVIKEEGEDVEIPVHFDGDPGFSTSYAYDWGMATYGKVIVENSNGWMPLSMVGPYVLVLPYALVILGLMVLTGIFGRFAMFAAGLLFMSLALGLFLIQDETAVFMILYVLLSANALFYSSHQRIGLTKL